MSGTRRDFAISAAAAAMTGALLPGAATAVVPDTKTLPEQLADALVELFGNHPGFREIHAKGVVCEGDFVPSSEAQTVSRAPHFSRPTPVTVRFSDFGGIPAIPSTDPNASLHGMALKFHTGSNDTDLVGAFENVALHSAARVDVSLDRAPVLLISGGADHLVTSAYTHSTFTLLAKSPAITAYKTFPGRPHFTGGDPGWEDVADFALEWALSPAAFDG